MQCRRNPNLLRLPQDGDPDDVLLDQLTLMRAEAWPAVLPPSEEQLLATARALGGGFVCVRPPETSAGVAVYESVLR